MQLSVQALLTIHSYTICIMYICMCTHRYVLMLSLIFFRGCLFKWICENSKAEINSLKIHITILLFQVCSNGTRVYVHNSLIKSFLERLVEKTRKIRVGDPLDSSTQSGALVSEAQMNKVLAYVDKGKQEVLYINKILSWVQHS